MKINIMFYNKFFILNLLRSKVKLFKSKFTKSLRSFTTDLAICEEHRAILLIFLKIIKYLKIFF